MFAIRVNKFSALAGDRGSVGGPGSVNYTVHQVGVSFLFAPRPFRRWLNVTGKKNVLESNAT